MSSQHEPKDMDTVAQEAVEAINAMTPMVLALADWGKALPRVPKTVTGCEIMGPALMHNGYFSGGAVAASNNVETATEKVLTRLTGKHLCFFRVLSVDVALFHTDPRGREGSLCALVTVVAEQCRKEDATPYEQREYTYPPRDSGR